MPLSKADTAAAGVLVLLGLMGAKKASASTGKKAPGGLPPPVDANKDIAALLKRANQKDAAAWSVVFADLPDHPVSPLTAAALSRWAGIESSGIPVGPKNPSRLDERGLMQAGPAAVAEGELTQAEFDALKDKKTTRGVQAALAVKYVDALANKAMTYVLHPPKDPIFLIWYSKLWHQRPVDVRDAGLVPLVDGKPQLSPTGHPAGMTGDAQADARALVERYSMELANARALPNPAGADAAEKALHRLRAANVVAFGTGTP